MNIIIKRLLYPALLLCMAVSLTLTSAMAANAPYSVTLKCEYGGSAISGADFHAYRVMEKSGAAYALTPEFAASGANIRAGADGKVNWADAANTLAVYAAAHRAAISSAAAVTDSGGECAFSMEKQGVYLILGDALTAGGGTYSFAPSLITLPDAGGQAAVTAIAKTVYTPASPSGGDPAEVTAIKIWNDIGQEDIRPASVTVTLLRDGSAFSAAELNESNGWRYTWNNLGSGFVWSVIEEGIPAEYTVSYSQNGNIFFVTNTYNTDIFPEQPPKTDIPSEPAPGAKLPQTGLLQWPVPVMAILGIVFFGLGWRERYGRHNHED